MNFLSWNCRGLGNPLTVLALQDIMSRFLPSVIFLMEVKIRRNKMEGIKRKLRYEGLFYVEGINNEGGLALLWKEKDMVNLLGFSKTFIDVGFRGKARARGPNGG